MAALERFTLREADGKTSTLMMAVQARAVIPGERVERLLGNATICPA